MEYFARENVGQQQEYMVFSLTLLTKSSLITSELIELILASGYNKLIEPINGPFGHNKLIKLITAFGHNELIELWPQQAC
jgi:hypothetical protein